MGDSETKQTSKEDLFPIELVTSPHLQRPMATDKIMRHVTWALLPVAAFAVFAFGQSALLVIIATTAACVLTEHVICLLSRKPATVGDFSAAITGILLGLTLPPGFPLWMAVVGGFVSIALGKALFGNLGFNVFNPALVGRAFLQAAFPAAISTWTPAFIHQRFSQLIPTTLTPPFMRPPSVAAFISEAAVDGWSGATPLSLFKFQQVHTEALDLFTGMTAGSAGETSALLILVCGAYLAIRKMMDWRIPVGVLGSVFIVSSLLYLLNSAKYPNPFFMLCSGGLMLGAIFMATDMVTSPTTPVGVWIFGILVGLVTLLIRLLGGLPEGVMYAILLGNALTPQIENLTQPRVYGTRKASAKQ